MYQAGTHKCLRCVCVCGLYGQCTLMSSLYISVFIAREQTPAPTDTTQNRSTVGCRDCCTISNSTNLGDDSHDDKSCDVLDSIQVCVCVCIYVQYICICTHTPKNNKTRTHRAAATRFSTKAQFSHYFQHIVNNSVM